MLDKQKLDNQYGLISIIMPCFNAEHYLYETIKCVLSQTYANLELLIVDDGSTDSSRSILSELSKSDHRLVVFHQQNSGPYPARNLALQHAKGDFIAFLDADDYCSPFAQFFARFIKLWQNIFICRCRRHGNTITHNQNRTSRRYSAAISADGQDEASRIAEQALSDARELARAKLWRNSGRVAGLYPERRRSSLELCTRLGGRNPDDAKHLPESSRLARIRF
ncbi:MAG: hypothetical protein RLZ75_3240 [Pseudomonadota bacterium]